MFDDLLEFYHTVIARYYSRKTLESMLLPCGKGRKPYQYITSLFLHTTTPHLLNNVNALINLAYPAYHEYGTIGVYCLFFGGGIVSAIPSFIHDWHRYRSLKDLERLITSKDLDRLPAYLKESVKTLWQSVQAGIPLSSCGSSGAVSAFSEYYLTLICRNVYFISRSIIRSIPPPQPHRVEELDKSGWRETMSRSWLEYFKAVGKTVRTLVLHLTREERHMLARNCMHIYGMAHYYLSEVDNVFGMFDSSKALGSLGTGKLINFAERVLQRNRTGHSSHVQGFFSGVAFTAVFGILVPAYQRRRMRQHL